MFTIKIDDRECNEVLLEVLKKEKNTTIHICRLPVGDYQIDECLLARLILYAARQIQSYGSKQIYPRPF